MYLLLVVMGVLFIAVQLTGCKDICLGNYLPHINESSGTVGMQYRIASSGKI